MDFNFDGGLNSVLRNRWCEIRVVDSSFGCRPNCHVLTVDTENEIRNGISEGKVDTDILHNLMLVMCWLMSKVFLVRGVKEHVELTLDRFVFGHINDPESNLDASPFVDLLPSFDRTHNLHLGNPTQREKVVRNIHVCDPRDPIDLYLLLQKYIKMVDPRQTRFYCYPVSNKKINYQMQMFGGIQVHSNPCRPVGKNAIATFCKYLAKRTGVLDWGVCTNHSWRAYGITQHGANKNITLSEGMSLSRHISTTSYAGYVRCDPSTERNRLEGIFDQSAKRRRTS